MIATEVDEFLRNEKLTKRQFFSLLLVALTWYLIAFTKDEGVRAYEGRIRNLYPEGYNSSTWQLYPPNYKFDYYRKLTEYRGRFGHMFIAFPKDPNTTFNIIFWIFKLTLFIALFVLGDRIGRIKAHVAALALHGACSVLSQFSLYFPQQLLTIQQATAEPVLFIGIILVLESTAQKQHPLWVLIFNILFLLGNITLFFKCDWVYKFLPILTAVVIFAVMLAIIWNIPDSIAFLMSKQDEEAKLNGKKVFELPEKVPMNEVNEEPDEDKDEGEKFESLHGKTFVRLFVVAFICFIATLTRNFMDEVQDVLWRDQRALDEMRNRWWLGDHFVTLLAENTIVDLLALLTLFAMASKFGLQKAVSIPLIAMLLVIPLFRLFQHNVFDDTLPLYCVRYVSTTVLMAVPLLAVALFPVKYRLSFLCIVILVSKPSIILVKAAHLNPHFPRIFHPLTLAMTLCKPAAVLTFVMLNREKLVKGKKDGNCLQKFLYHYTRLVNFLRLK